MKHVYHFIALITLLGAVALAQDAPKKVSRSEALGAVASRVQPDYPAMARQLKIEGSVELEAAVSEKGAVTKVQILSGNAILTNAASQAVKQWKFKPFMEDGKAISVLAPITVNFKM
jgi:periplasmic protein TonB